VTAFVDTGAWIALLVPQDVHHARARGFFQSIAPSTQLITSNYVLAETVTWLSYHRLRRTAFTLRDMVEAAESTNLLTTTWITQQFHSEAWEFFQRFDDHEISFCDCTSFAVCRSKVVDFVFGFDRDFLLAGFDLRPGS
jgi:predicted nucleic acid-binding protein